MKKLLLLSALLIFACSFGQTKEEYFENAVDKYEAKDYYGAIRDFNKVIEFGEYANAYKNRGFSKYYIKDYNGAISDYTKVIELELNASQGEITTSLNRELILLAYSARCIAKYLAKDLSGACEDAKKSKSLGYDKASGLIEILCK